MTPDSAFLTSALCPLPSALSPLSCSDAHRRCNILPFPRRPHMSRRFAAGAVLLVALTWAFVPSTPSAQSAQSAAPAVTAGTPAGPIKLARYPDYHAGRIAFSYMGDIWVAGEDGSNPVRLTVNTARETYP